MKYGFWGVLLALSMVCAISSCGTDEKEVVPDVSDITLTNKLVRFDVLLSALDTNNLNEEITLLRNDYTEFYNVFFQHVLPFDVKTEEGFLSNLRGYLGDSRIQHLQDTTALVYSDFESEIKPKLDHAMKMMKYYFPDFEAPNMYTYTSEYTLQRFVFSDKDRDGIGIGLDMFLGSNYPYKAVDPNNPAFSQYLTRSFDKQHLPKKTMDLLLDNQVGPSPGSRLLDQMINNGKKLYILDKILPLEPDSVIMEYTTKQIEWVQENEKAMWAFFFDENMFYESNSMKINKYINSSPNSPGMPDDAPGRTANYLGLQIVKAYMKKFPNTTLQQLIDIKDSQRIMDKSKYKPKR